MVMYCSTIVLKKYYVLCSKEVHGYGNGRIRYHVEFYYM